MFGWIMFCRCPVLCVPVEEELGDHPHRAPRTEGRGAHPHRGPPCNCLSFVCSHTDHQNMKVQAADGPWQNMWLAARPPSTRKIFEGTYGVCMYAIPHTYRGERNIEMFRTTSTAVVALQQQKYQYQTRTIRTSTKKVEPNRKLP